MASVPVLVMPSLFELPVSLVSATVGAVGVAVSRVNEKLVAALEGYDQVVGARTTEEGTMKGLRVPAKWLIRKLAEFLSKTEIPDLNSGFRAFRREVALQYLHLLPAGFSCVTTITMAFHRIRLLIRRSSARSPGYGTSSSGLMVLMS